ncbi:MAG: GTPase ObgE [Candidatus Krumholzibacteriota bacterium]|nr:GTPase ObgE [Candidatus Krumholzibacteriota bacterium]
MNFIDRVEIHVKAGDGGDGCVSFRREKYVPRGGPDGGNGGRGGDVVIAVEPQMRTLLDLRYRREYKGKKGGQGEGARKTGKSADQVVIKVPPGTIIEDLDSGQAVADLTSESDSILVATGGQGGKGNFIFRSARNQAPQKATPGKQGEERNLSLTLKLIADVGLVGLPNAGKSTLLSSVTDARPLVADYPFSTLTPNLGIVKVDRSASFCMIDIPGLIEGAHTGKGLGLQFLQHVERCRVLLFVIDISGDSPPEDIYGQLIAELGAYSKKLLELPRYIALNKIDILPEADRSISFRTDGGETVFEISAVSGEGLPDLVQELYRKLIEELSGDKKEDDETFDPASDL